MGARQQLLFEMDEEAIGVVLPRAVLDRAVHEMSGLLLQLLKATASASEGVAEREGGGHDQSA